MDKVSIKWFYRFSKTTNETKKKCFKFITLCRAMAVYIRVYMYAMILKIYRFSDLIGRSIVKVLCLFEEIYGL
jgi:hypothetical protein